ncbi:MAG: DUF1566 domain-containing protein [Clostridia bacterium]|nr:DUF1566 domain-containing protein [Clostridia bacterium]MBT7123338.1 DUF1566 domain-containing protein [Clostridia bacterium]
MDRAEAQQTSEAVGKYAINDTGQTMYFDNTSEIAATKQGEAFYGQDAQYVDNAMSFEDNGDGTVSDSNTGLMWQQDPGGVKMTWDEAMSGAESFSLGGYDDWRLPTIKELYSLIDFSGTDPDPTASDTSSLVPFIDTDYFVFEYGDESAGERIIDAQYASSTKYVSTQDGELAFGVNFADGRIKGYGLTDPLGGEKTFFVMHVRGNTEYGQNNFIDNSDGTITDTATGLMWMSADSGQGMDWEDALAWSENLEQSGYDDWRLPDAKELQSIVDYTRSPETTGTAAIDELFECTQIADEGGEVNYPYYWTSTTHISSRDAGAAVYIAFGQALGFMTDGPPQSGSPDPNADPDDYTLTDVHGAGAQRSDPKTGDNADFPFGRGPQGDVVRIDNFVRCVRSVEVG